MDQVGKTLRMRVSQGFWRTREHWQNIEGNKGTLVNFWEQGTKFRKITVRKHSERVWEHGNIGQFWKGTWEQGPPWETLEDVSSHLKTCKVVDDRIENEFQLLLARAGTVHDSIYYYYYYYYYYYFSIGTRFRFVFY